MAAPVSTARMITVSAATRGSSRGMGRFLLWVVNLATIACLLKAYSRKPRCRNPTDRAAPAITAKTAGAQSAVIAA